ncbi:MAG TPA: TIGR03067 domain-containing protein, partial [Isosphaeraceae bacterium]
MKAVAIPLLIVIATAASSRAAAGPAELQGRWELVSIEADGKGYPVDTPARCEIVGDRVRYGGSDLAVIAADPSASPRSIDLRFGATERTYEGVYAREKETLKVCLNRRTDVAKERPHVLST